MNRGRTAPLGHELFFENVNFETYQQKTKMHTK